MKEHNTKKQNEIHHFSLKDKILNGDEGEKFNNGSYKSIVGDSILPFGSVKAVTLLIPNKISNGIDESCQLFKNKYSRVSSDHPSETKFMVHLIADYYRKEFYKFISISYTQDKLNKISKDKLQSFLSENVNSPLMEIFFSLYSWAVPFFRSISREEEELKDFLLVQVTRKIDDFFTSKKSENLNVGKFLQGSGLTLPSAKIYLEIAEISKRYTTKNFNNTIKQLMEKRNYNYKDNLGMSEDKIKKIDEGIADLILEKKKFPKKVVSEKEAIVIIIAKIYKNRYLEYCNKHSGKPKSIENVIQSLEKAISRLLQNQKVDLSQILHIK